MVRRVGHAPNIESGKGKRKTSGLMFSVRSNTQIVYLSVQMTSPPSQLRIALAQTCPICAPETTGPTPSHPFSVLERNLVHVREQVIYSAKQGADIVVFPEYFLQGLVNEGRQVSSSGDLYPTPFGS